MLAILSLASIAHAEPLGNVGLIRAQNAGNPWSRTSVKGADRFEVRSGDHLPGDGSSKERSEMFSSRKLPAGRPFDISFDMMIEPGHSNTAAWLLLAQLQSASDKGETPHSPPFALEMAGERMRVVSRADPRRISTDNSFVTTRHYDDTHDIKRGTWYRIRIVVTFDPFGEGRLAVWRNGLRLVDYRGAIGFNDAAGVYYKQGVYRASARERFAARFRRLQIRAVAQ
ncbi:MAG: heparin lyase I family protein [Sphingobium sp.]